MNKAYNLHVRITEEQLTYLSSQCQIYGVNCSVYVRRLLDAQQGKAVPGQTQEEYLQKKQLIYEINRIGNNINEIVKSAHMEFYSEAEKKKLFAMMTKIIHMMESEGQRNDDKGQ